MDAIALHQYGFDCAVASLGTALTDDGATLLSRYTDQVVLIYDGDTAGQNATQRAIPMLEKAGLQVKVLKMRDAKDPDEFLKKYGADRFKILLEESSNRVEYQLAAILRKYDLRDDDQKVRYLQESADLIGSLPSGTSTAGGWRRPRKSAPMPCSWKSSGRGSGEPIRRRKNRKKSTCLPPGIYSPRAGTSAIPI